MTANANKGIALIKYNLLNLPEKIYFMNGNKIEYKYDATGVKHQAKYITALNPLQIPLGSSAENLPSNVLKKDSIQYSNGHIYKNKLIDKLLLPEGYLQSGGSFNNMYSLKYCYSLKDYQGNTRANVSNSIATVYNTTPVPPVVSGQIDYYPFGMEITPGLTH